MARRYLIGLLIFIVFISSAIFLMYKPNPQTQSSRSNTITPTTTITINQTTFATALASTPEQQTKGLGGITSLHPDQAMYFSFNSEPNVTFWMKDMLIPIDILWIADKKVAGISANIAPPPAHTLDSQLAKYTSPVLYTDGVLEIAANRAAQLKIKVGDTISPPPNAIAK